MQQKKVRWTFILWLDPKRSEDQIYSELCMAFPEFERNGIDLSSFPVDLLDAAFFTKKTKWHIKGFLKPDRTINQIINIIRQRFPEAMSSYPEVFRSYPRRGLTI